MLHHLHSYFNEQIHDAHLDTTSVASLVVDATMMNFHPSWRTAYRDYLVAMLTELIFYVRHIGLESDAVHQVRVLINKPLRTLIERGVTEPNLRHMSVLNVCLLDIDPNPHAAQPIWE